MRVAFLVFFLVRAPKEQAHARGISNHTNAFLYQVPFASRFLSTFFSRLVIPNKLLIFPFLNSSSSSS